MTHSPPDRRASCPPPPPRVRGMTGHRSLLPYAPVALAALCLAATTATAQNSGTVSITSTPSLKSAVGVMPEVRYYSAGETITVRITPTGGARVGRFRAYHNSNIDDEDTTFTLNVGDVKRTVSRNYYSGESGGYAEFRYTVVAADRDTNGVSVDANAFGGNVYLTTGGTRSSPRLTNGALADQSGHVVRGAQTVPAFAQGSISFTFGTGAAVSGELPVATGGEGGLTYALAAGSTLPTGLIYTPPGSTDTHGGTISGTAPATSQATTSYSVTVTDGDGDSDTLTVNIALGNRNTFKADNAYAVSPASLSARTSSQPLGVAGFPSWTGRSVHACRRQLTLRTTPVGASECRQVAAGASPTAVTLSQAEIDNGGIVVVVWDGAGVVLAQWVAVLPVAPGSFTATPSVGEVALGWDDPGNASISHYEARHRRSGGSWGAWTEIAASDQDTTAHEVTGLDAGTAYEFEVRAVNTGGDGAAASVTATAPGLVFSAASTTVPEGGSGTYTAALASRPSAAVTVRVTSDNADVDTSPGTLAFTRDNWSAAQMVTVRATADDDGADDTATLAHRAAGGDYDTLAATHSVTVTDPETQGVSISPTTLRVPEGRSATYRMELDTEPTGAVTVTVSRTGSAGVTFEPASLTFNAANWVRAPGGDGHGGDGREHGRRDRDAGPCGGRGGLRERGRRHGQRDGGGRRRAGAGVRAPVAGGGRGGLADLPGIADDAAHRRGHGEHHGRDGGGGRDAAVVDVRRGDLEHGAHGDGAGDGGRRPRRTRRRRSRTRPRAEATGR